MKISILGFLIDTEDIYMITPVTKPAGNRKFDDSGNSGHRESDWQFQFTIKFFNEKSHKITQHEIPSLNQENHKRYIGMSYDDYYKARLNELRDKIIEQWEPSQTLIKKIEF